MGSAPVNDEAFRLTARTLIPIGRTRAAIARPMSPYPMIPMVWPDTGITSKASTRRLLTTDHAAKVFREYKIAASVKLAQRCAEYAAPFVSGTGLSISSGNSVLSKPTSEDCRLVIRQSI